MIRPRVLHGIDPPCAVVPVRDRIVLHRRDERVPLAQETPQHRIDHPFREHELTPRADCGHGLIDDGERRIRGVGRLIKQQRDRASEQRMNMRGRRLADEPANQPVRAAKTAHRPVCDILRGTARRTLRAGRHAREHRGQRSRQRGAALDRIDRLGGRIERERKRIGREVQRGQAARTSGRRFGGRTGSCHRCEASAGSGSRGDRAAASIPNRAL